MPIQNQINNLKSREIKFSTLKTALKHKQLLSSNGWDNLEMKYSEFDNTATPSLNHASELQKIYIDNVKWGDKAIQIVQFNSSNDNLLKEICNKSDFDSDFSPSSEFLFPLSAAELAQLTLKPQFVGWESNADNATFYFYSRAYQISRDSFDVNVMKDEISQQRFAGYDQVYATKQSIFLRIDSVYIDYQNRRFEFRVDITRMTSNEKITEALIDLKAKFRHILSTQINRLWETINFPMLNFFPKINNMYNSNSGELIAIGYNTEAGAINYGKMRGHGGDLKLDPSHMASMDASLTQKFAIKKMFSFYNDASKISLSIIGKSNDTANENPQINTAIIENCIDELQFEKMMQKLR